GDLLEAVLSQSGYLEALEAERTIEAQGRLENLEQLVEVGREFDASAEAEQDTLEVFLQQLALVADADSRREQESLVTLMTLHNAKGLEYPIVFIVGCEDGVFPHSRALDEGGLEEERRLFYVGVTRAMRELYLTYARRRSVFGAQSYGLPSRFLEEIPSELVDRQDDLASPPGGVRVGAASTEGWSSGGAGASSRGWVSAGPGAPRRRGALPEEAVSAGSAPTGRGPSRARGARSSSSSSSHSSSATSFRLGEDVVHPAFGEGVVTGVEPGGIIVVRFSGDGSERKLMAEYAPVSRR
ncbi:MAG TPA: 3'-5' exonuclease, partial [Vicinamibacteria bacterium]|nr:3'-5' exonuclease [Vicinamibacteria bacterium]